ncbi:MAG: hypothetical protein ACLFRG_21780 [Desulfococcaceae bacterium]
MTPLRVLVAHNRPAGSGPDRISEAGVEAAADAARSALETLGYDVVSLALETPAQALETLAAYRPDAVVNLCEGLAGDARHEMHVAALWELAGIPYTGSPPLALGISRDKATVKRLLESAGIATPEWALCETVPNAAPVPFPAIVKPVREDASLGIGSASVVGDLSALRRAVADLLERYRQPALVERFIPGREFNAAILGNDPPRLLPLAEIDFSGLPPDAPAIVGYEAKWLPGHPLYRGTPAVCPASVTPELTARITEAALGAWALTGGRDYGRVDLRVAPDGRVFVLEVNLNPDTSPDAGFARAAAAAGISYPNFFRDLVRWARERSGHDRPARS